MATVKTFMTVDYSHLPAGQSRTFRWNNAPYPAVYSFSVWPVINSNNNSIIERQPALAEVTNVRQRFKRGFAYVQKQEMEVLCTVRNLSAYAISFKVYMSIAK